MAVTAPRLPPAGSVAVVGWFPAELLEEVRLARAEDLAERRGARERARKARNGVAGPRRNFDEFLTELGRSVDIGDRITRRSRHLGVSVIAGAGRLAFGLALVARVVIAVWIVEVFDPPVLVLAVAVVGVTAALRQMVGNCLARRWRHWALAAVSAWVAVVVAVSVVVGVSGGRPFMAVAFVVSEFAAWLALVLFAQARIQGGAEVVVA